MRRWSQGLMALATLGGVVACASLLGPRTVEISREELLSKLGKRFPASQRILNVLDIQVSAPDLAMLPDSNRVSAGFDLSATDLLGGKDYKGQVKLSFGLRYEPQDLSIRLTQVKVEHIALAGLPAVYQRSLTRLGAWVAEDRLQDYTVHRFKPEDLRSADRMGYQVGDIVVTAKGLAIHLTPKP